MPDTVDPLDWLYASGRVVRPQLSPQQAEYEQLNREANALNPVELLGKGFTSGGNTALNLYNDFNRSTAAGEPDPQFDREGWIEQHKDQIPPNQAWRFMQTKNSADSGLLLGQMQAQGRDAEVLQARGGFTPFVASGLAGLIDIDAPLMLLSGGAAGVEKAGILSTRFGRLAAGAAYGGVTGASVAAINVAADPTADWTSIPAAALMGMGIGGVGALAHAGNTSVRDAQNEFSQAVADGHPIAGRITEQPLYPDVTDERTVPPEGAEPKAFDVPEDTGTGQSTVGAAQLNSGGGINSVQNAEQQALIINAQTRFRKGGYTQSLELENGWDKVDNVAPGVARAAQTLNRFIRASPLRSLFQQFQDTSSTVAKMLGQDTLVNPRGIATNAKSGAMLRYQYQQALMASGIPEYSKAFDRWSAAQGKTWLERQFNTQHMADFEREVALELQTRRYGNEGETVPARPIDPNVKAAADAHDKFSELELKTYQGREGEKPVNGWEDIKWKPGYMEQRWSGQKMRKMIDSSNGTITNKTLGKVVADEYIKRHDWMTPDKAKLYAQAVVDRALQSADGISTDLTHVFNADGRDAIEAMMLRNGVPGKDVQDLLDHLTTDMDTNGLQGRTKQRIDADLRSSSDGIQLVDMVETNLLNGMGRRARGASGRAALARTTGIAGPADRAMYKAAILAEQKANRVGGASSLEGTPLEKAEQLARDAMYNDKDLTPEQIDDYFSVWTEGATGGGISPAYSRVMKLTNLSLLNMLGLTQLAETGPLIAAYGWEKFIHYAGESIESSLKDKHSPLTEELAHMGVFVPEHDLFRPDMNHELEKAAGIQTEFMAGVDHALNMGQRMQGMMSGYYKIKEFQQRIAVTAGADKIMTFLAGLKTPVGFSPERLAEIGLSPELQGRLKALIDKGVVEFKEGNSTGSMDTGMGEPGLLNERSQYLHKLNLDQWDHATREEFVNVLNMQMFKQVQQAMAGETSMVFHKDGLASLFLHLKSFPLLAMAKQAERHLRYMDSESLGALIYGLMTSGAVYTAAQTLKGNTDNLTPEKVMKGAFGMSNLTGWMPMFTDPVASMFGMDNLKFNTYTHGIDNDVFSIPAAFTAMNRMAHIPGALASPIVGTLGLGAGPNANDMRALQATPIVGNAYALAGLFGLLKNANASPGPRKTGADVRPKSIGELVQQIVHPSAPTE